MKKKPYCPNCFCPILATDSAFKENIILKNLINKLIPSSTINQQLT